MYLVDTNVWLERLLDQARSEEVGQLLATVPTKQLAVTDFAFHSIGVILSRLGEQEVLLRFTQDVLLDGGVPIVRLQPEDTPAIVGATESDN